ncbi:hypothetical protein GE061_013034 [Apolygus lucorum]|uniref:Uncharacterized protein n=1 Tax=Apolygus lucorum TaxID=248454 RepID=A0A6A4JUD1_APOLU|nr:hypothetical protein GE061_013034 [Apolygus lucorum]
MLILSFLLQWLWLGEVPGIENGEKYKALAYPWLAGLLDEKDWTPRCSGTLISRFYVLTASVCLLHRATETTWDLIDPGQFIIVIPAQLPTCNVREIEVVLVHPNLTESSMYYAGLVGIWPYLDFDPKESSILPIWSENVDSLKKEMDYVLERIETFRCFLVTWFDIFSGLPDTEGLSEPPYKVDWVSVMEVRPLNETHCEKLICGKENSSTSCRKRLEGLLCLTIVMPPKSRLCGADRGASLACSRFLWGVWIGGASCTNSDPLPISLRIDVVSDFIFEHYNRPFRKPKNDSSVTEPTLLQYLAVAVLYAISQTSAATQ